MSITDMISVGSSATPASPLAPPLLAAESGPSFEDAEGSLRSELWTLASAGSEEMSWLAELYSLTEAALTYT